MRAWGRYLQIAILLYSLCIPALSLCQVKAPRVFLADPATLLNVRSACLSHEASVGPPLKKLIRDADKLLQSAPVSVMEKTQVPPSGDKHDYMSLGRYFWPDPTKPDGLPYINRDGETNPEAAELPDHGNIDRMSKSVHTLALAYFLTGRDAYAEHACRFLRTWFLDSATNMNPNLNFAQGVKGKISGRSWGVLDARVFTLAIDGVGMLEGYKGWTISDRDSLVRWFEQYLDWMLTSKNGRGEAQAENNHGVWYDVQATSIALFVGRQDVARRILEEAKVRRIAKQIEPDGRQPRELARTTSEHYTAFNLEALFTLAALGANTGVDLWHYQTEDGRSIRKALDWVLPFLRGEQKWSHKQIKKFDPAVYYPLLLQASHRYDSPAYSELAWKLRGARGESDPIHLLIGR